MRMLTVGELAKEAGVGAQTIRYYERIKLLAPAPRSPGGHRQYPPEEVARVRFIKQAQSLGFSLEEIRGLLQLRTDPASTCAQVKARAQEKIAAIEAKIAGLEAMRSALVTLARQCRPGDPISACPILDAMQGGEAPPGGENHEKPT
jgi:MerR family mercuric resistance operon transcriptional regulator